MKLTQATIERLKSDKADAIFYDDEVDGFGVRIREGGSRTYVVRYRLGGLERRHTLGKVGVLTLDDARKRARKALTAVDDGKDPTAEKATKKAASSLIFSSVMRDYLDARKPEMKPRSYDECERHLEQHWKPLHRLPVSNVSRQVVASHLRAMTKERGPVAANRARSTLSAMFAWAIGEGLCEINPVDGTNKSAESERERVLTDAELVAIWKHAGDSDYGRIVRLLMLTAQRREEIGGLRWSEIEGEGNTALIALPGARTKNGKQHDVPLSKDARAVLAQVVQREGRALVFGEGEGGYSGWSRSKERLDDACGVKDWTLHDLRRTGATRMAESGVQPHVIEAALNHVSGHKAGVAGIYNRATYATEKRAALDTLANYIKTAIAKADGANVTRIRA